MASRTHNLLGVCAFEYGNDAKVLCNVQDAVDLIAEASAQAASLVILPMDRLDPRFFQLRTGLAGEMLQKFVNYRVRLAVVGDFAELASQSGPLRDFIYESNRGRDVWFMAGLEELKGASRLN
jgi:hypothetical protein